MLLSHLYGRARDVCISISDDVINPKSDTDTIVSAIHKRNQLTVVWIVHSELITLMNVKRIVGKSFCDFELRFNAQLSRFNALAKKVALTHSIFGLMKLANAIVN